MFDLLQIRNFMKDPRWTNSMNAIEKNGWNSFVMVVLNHYNEEPCVLKVRMVLKDKHVVHVLFITHGTERQTCYGMCYLSRMVQRDKHSLPANFVRRAAGRSDSRVGGGKYCIFYLGHSWVDMSFNT